ncbi:MAG TPA: hypothetical protein VMV69_28595 [Pirellulales bacterium]|nr:hypothetical protein [Pirellulales bacterium]
MTHQPSVRALAAELDEFDLRAAHDARYAAGFVAGQKFGRSVLVAACDDAEATRAILARFEARLTGKSGNHGK